jgi:hypothetical protein
MNLPELIALKAGDKVHRSTWKPHPCIEFTVTSTRDFDGGKRFVFVSKGSGLRDNEIITAVNCSGFHVLAECWAVKESQRLHAAAVQAALDRMQEEQMAAIADESNL